MGRWGDQERFGNGAQMEHFLIPNSLNLVSKILLANNLKIFGIININLSSNFID
ncbi:MAG: hypothetical protein F6K01_16410 [Okeania sp. SIO1I7]|nr:hypothetical protein [Okeania sp. SIO1I7]